MRNKEQKNRKRHPIATEFFCLTRLYLRKTAYILFSLLCFSFVLTSCKKENNVRKLQDKSTEASGSSVSEEEALSMAKDLESLEQKEQESLDKEYGSKDDSSTEAEANENASDAKSGEKSPDGETEGEEESYPYEDYPYDPKEDRGDKHYATQINDWYMNFQDYEGKTVSIDGYYMNFGGYTLVGRMGPSCPYCTGGYVNFEFKTDLDLSKLKSEESWIRVKGILRKGKYSISNDLSQLIYYIEALDVEELPEVGVDTVTD